MSDNGDKSKEKEKGKESVSNRSRVRLSLRLPPHFQMQATITADVFDALQVFLQGGISLRETCPHLHVLTGLWEDDPTAAVSVSKLSVCIFFIIIICESYVFVHSAVYAVFSFILCLFIILS